MTHEFGRGHFVPPPGHPHAPQRGPADPDLSTVAGSLEYLGHVADLLKRHDGGACAALLTLEKFREWPASTSKHHVWKGGLVQHTAQVLHGALRMCDTAALSGRALDATVVACAAIYHDAGKIHDYDRVVDMQTGLLAGWEKNEHYRMVHHVVKSAEMWHDTYVVPGAFKDAVKHCILAHHGRREWGSPVVPATQEAWCVHLADMSSVQCVEVRKAGPE